MRWQHIFKDDKRNLSRLEIGFTKTTFSLHFICSGWRIKPLEIGTREEHIWLGVDLF
jgi:hypothetical protein